MPDGAEEAKQRGSTSLLPREEAGAPPSGQAVPLELTSIGFEPRKPSNSSWRNLWKMVGFCALLAALFYFMHFYMEANKIGGAAIAEHFSIVFTVACISILAIDYNASKRHEEQLNEIREEFSLYRKRVELDLDLFKAGFVRYQEQAEEQLRRFDKEFARYRDRVSKAVFEAVLGRVVHESIVEEVKEFLRGAFMKTECQYTIRFLGPYEEMSKDYCVLRRDLSFTVTNVSSGSETFSISSSYTADEDLDSAAWRGRPFHLELSVNGKDIPKEKYLEDERGFNLKYEVPLGPQESAKIFLRGEEPMHIEASRSFYYQNTPVDKLEVIIENNYESAIGQVDVQVHHPGYAQVKHDPHRNRYLLERAFLPGQGFEVIWKPAEKRAGKDEAHPVRQMALLNKAK